VAKIQRLSYCTVAVPLAEPIAFATAGVSVRCFGLLKVHDADGAVGIAYAYLGAKPIGLAGQAIEELLSTLVVGEEAADVERLWDRMTAETQLHGGGGVVLRAMALIDIGLWDLSARKAGLPLYRHLGSAPRAAVPAYAAGGYYGPNKGLPELVAELQGLRELGFRSIKIKTGKGSPAEEQARVQAARAAIGSDADLMLDANNAWPDVETALRYLDAVKACAPYWIEEPFLEDDVEDLKALASASGIRVATGENEANPLRFKEVLQGGGVAVIQPDATVVGGVTPWMRIAKMAAAHSVTVCPHAYHNLHVHLLAASGSKGMLEFMPGENVMNFGRLITEDLTFGNGEVHLPATPGLGFDFVEKAVARYAVGGGWREIR
jgi:L-alanine-DL-glutamate epimerase-like enolase superfamily enzyme